MSAKSIVEVIKETKTKEEIKEILEKASESYYNSDSKILSDTDYDELSRYYISIGGELIVGAEPKEGKGTINVSHEFGELVGTLDKAKNLDDLREWLEKKIKVLGYIPSFLVTLKFDGNSIVIEYKNGKIVRVLTRGKNGKGLDLTHVFHHKIKCKDNIGIKYEVIMTYENFDKLQKDFNEDYANPRSIVAGKLGDDNAAEYEKYFTLVPLWVKEKTKIIPRKEQLDFIEKEFGEEVCVFDYIYEFDKEEIWSLDELMKQFSELYEIINNKREELNYMIDGIVFEIMEQEARDKLGTTEKYPNWAIALKFPYMEKTTKVIGFDYCLGDGGKITPRVWFEPVDFNGTVHRKQSLQNFKRFEELKLGIGSDILVQYRHDVLSYIEPLDTDNNKTVKPEPFTDKCPVCGGKIRINENRTFAYCDNPKCQGRLIGSVQNYLTKMDIKGTKSNTLEKLKDNGLLKGIKDLYTMDYTKIYDIEGLGEKTAENMKKNIESKEAFDYEILGALGINNVATSTAKDVCAIYSLEELLTMENSSDNLIEHVEGVAEITASYIVDGL